MKKLPPAALVCAGPVSRSRLWRVPGLHDCLRWIKSANISTATRAVHTLGCGSAVREYVDLADAATVIIKAPDCAVARIVDELAGSGLDWAGRIVVLFDSELDSGALSRLEKLGGVPASLNLLEVAPETLLVEGHQEAVRYMRRLARCAGTRLLQLRRNGKAEYFAGLRLATCSFLSSVSATADHFVRAGMEKRAAERTAVSLFESSIRAYSRAGKRLLVTPR